MRTNLGTIPTIFKCLLSFFLGLGMWAGTSSIAPQTVIAAPTDAEILHVINRLSFGPSPGDIQHVQSIGIEAYLQEQLSPEQLEESPELLRQLSQFKTLSLTPIQLEHQHGFKPSGKGQPKKLRPGAQKRQNRRDRTPLHEASAARVMRAISSSHQLEEVMTQFWFNHFNVSATKGKTRLWVGSYEQEAIRPFVLGSFRDLLGATAKHPAMLFYLDNWQNTAPDSPGARGRFKGLNENYARELLELHTMGVKGAYSQADVMTAARILTGWGLPQRRQQVSASQGFYFDPRRHDTSPKEFMGQSIQRQGLAEGELLLDILANHPATAYHISFKLAQYFVSDTPPAALVDRLTQRFQATDGNIRAVLATLFQSPEFRDQQYYGQKFKTPYEYLLSVSRVIGSPSVDPPAITGALKQFGMPLYECRTPNGYAHTQTAWLNPDAMIRRVSLATAFARGRGRQRIIVKPDRLKQTLGGYFSAHTQSVIDSSPPALQTALMLGSPEMMYR